MMRNDNNDRRTLDANTNKYIKNQAKYLAKSLNLEFHNNDAGMKLKEDQLKFNQNNINIHLDKKLGKLGIKIPSTVKNNKKPLTLCVDDKNSIHHARLGFVDPDYPVLNQNHVLKLNQKLIEKSKLQFDVLKNVNDDSRLTGGGTKSLHININKKYNYKNPLQSPIKKDVLPLTKKNSIETNYANKISFKTKNTTRKPAHCAKSNGTTQVAVLAEKFNEIIKGNINKENPRLNNDIKYKLDKKSTEKRNPLLSDTDLKLSRNNKIPSKNQGTQKRTPSISSIDRIETSSSITNKKVIRLKSDTSLKKKNIVKKKSSENTKTDNVDNAIEDSQKDHLDIDNSKSNIKRRISFKTSPTRSNTVRATIKKFESEKNQIDVKKNLDTNIEIKPKLPEKKTNLSKTKNIVVKDGKPKIKLLKKNESETKTNEINICHKILDIEPLDANCERLSDKTSEAIINSFPNAKTESKDSITIPNNDKKEFHYDKFSIHRHSEKLKIITTECIDDIQKDTVAQELNINSINTADDKLNESTTLSTDTIPIEVSEIVSGKLKPNESFLWRVNSKTDSIISCDQSDIVSQIDFTDLYQAFIPTKNESIVQCDSSMTSIEELYPSYKTLLQKTDELLEMKKREIAHQFKFGKATNSQNLELEPEAININIGPGYIIEAINMPAINDIQNIRREISLMCIENEDEYEILEPFSVEHEEEEPPKLYTKSFRGKVNCPLPEVPIAKAEESDNIYQCLHDRQSPDDNCSIHNYEYCHSKSASAKKVNKIGDDDGYEYCKAPKETDKIDSSEDVKYRFTSISKSNSVTSSVGYEKISSIYEKNPPKPLYEESYYSENIYDTIKSDNNSSVSGYEGIPEPMKKKFSFKSLLQNKHNSYDTISNMSLSTISSDQKTNSIYGRRSLISMDKHNVYGEALSEISLSDRSDEWEDISDQEKPHKDTKTIQMRERSKGKHNSPTSWSRKFRNHIKAKESTDSDYVDSSDGEHIYEPVFPRPQRPTIVDHREVPFEDDFDSDSESEQSYIYNQKNVNNHVNYPQLPDPPASSNIYTLTHFASVAGKKMKQLKLNLTKGTRKKSVVNMEKPIDSKQEQVLILPKSDVETSNETIATPKLDDFRDYQNVDRPLLKKEEPSPVIQSRLADVPHNLENSDIKSGSEGKKSKPKTNTYLSLKSKFRKSILIGNNNQATSPNTPPGGFLNSTFYLDSPTDSKYSSSNQLTDLSTENVPITNSLDEYSKNTQSDQDLSNGKKSSPLLVKSNTIKVNMRPSVPPPPPPDDIKQYRKGRKSTISASSWYAECGLFNGDINPNGKERPSSTSWYAEIGLYQASNISTSSGTSSTMSGSGTCSTTTAFSSSSTPTPPLGMFNQEPLYQFYDAAKLESVCRDINNGFDSDNYEEISPYKELKEVVKPVQRPPVIASILPHKGPSRTLWCEIPEVINSSILDTLNPKQRKLQEAKFEIITSEASYLNSLTVLETSYISNPAFQDEITLTKKDKQMLFGNILPVKRCSERLLAELEACWQDDIMLRGLCKIVKNHADKHFQVYVTYCENQIHLNKTLKKLKSDTKFNKLLDQLQSQPACQSLALDSFLLLPMQRATRFPLLLDAVLKHLDEASGEYPLCVDALTSINNVVCKCNEGARNIERIEEMFTISSRIEFPPHIKDIPIMIANDTSKKNTPTRWLIRSGELTHLIWRGDDQSKLTFGKKFGKASVYIFLFTDLLVVTKRKSGEEYYTVIDYCKRSLIEMTSSTMLTQLPIKETAGKFIVLLTLLENHEEKTVEMLMSCSSETDRQRWMEAVLPPASNNPDERVYESWDCPQVMAQCHYITMQPDELMLQPGDIINVNKKMVDGWYQGERIRDGEIGWFPGNFTVEIASSHARARNLRQRYRILELSGSYLRKNKPTSY